MNALDQLEEIKELVNECKKFKYKNIVNFNCNDIKNDLNYAIKCHSLEEQIGCPLEVVVKALKNGVYYEDVANCMKYIVVDLHFNLEGDFVLYFDDEERLLARNYKKTWWLKIDKSE